MLQQFGVRSMPDGAAEESTVRSAILSIVPLGSSVERTTSYLDSLGVQRSYKFVSRPYYTVDLQGSVPSVYVRIPYRGSYTEFGDYFCGFSLVQRFTFDETRHLKGIDASGGGTCL